MGSCVLFGPNAARVVGFCRTMEHETGQGARPYLAAQARARAEE